MIKTVHPRILLGAARPTKAQNQQCDYIIKTFPQRFSSAVCYINVSTSCFIAIPYPFLQHFTIRNRRTKTNIMNAPEGIFK